MAVVTHRLTASRDGQRPDALMTRGVLPDGRLADRLREGDGLFHVRDFDLDPVAGPGPRDDDDEAAFDLGDAVALVAERINGNRADLALLDGRAFEL